MRHCRESNKIVIYRYTVHIFIIYKYIFMFKKLLVKKHLLKPAGYIFFILQKHLFDKVMSILRYYMGIMTKMCSNLVVVVGRKQRPSANSSS